MSTDDEKKPLSLRNTVTWVSLITSIVSILGTIFLYWQIKTAEENVRISSLGDIYSQMLEIDKLFTENPELRLYIYYNKTPEEVYSELSKSMESNIQLKPKDTDMSLTSIKSSYDRMKREVAANAAGELMLDFFSLVILELPKLGEAGEPWRRYIKDIYKCSPVVRTMYEEKYAWYDMEIPSNVFEQAKNELSSSSAPCNKFKWQK